MTLRALNRTTQKEAACSSTQFGVVNFQPKAPKDKDKNEKGNVGHVDQNQEKGDKFGDVSGGADTKVKAKG